MSISYMKIIKEVMGEEAQNRGYKITSHPKLLATKPLAYFRRKINGFSQEFEITEYLIGPRTIFLRVMGKEIHLEYDDEETFRNCIKKFHNYMITEGYELLEKNTEVPVFSTNDILFVKNNYEALAKDFYKERPVSFEKGVELVVENINIIIDSDWDEIKSELMGIAGALTFILLKEKENSKLTESTTTDSFFVEYDSEKHMRIDPVRLVYNSYMRKDPDKWIIKKLINNN